MNTVLQDLRFGLRLLLKNPGFTAVVIVTLALCVGVNTAVFSIVSAMLYPHLPFSEPERLMRIWRTSPNSQHWPHALGDYLDFREQNNVFEQVAAFHWQAPTLSEKDALPEVLQGMRVSANFFSVLGVGPLWGRTFLADEDQPGKNSVVVLGEELWLRRFAGDTNILGRSILLDGKPVTVVGVMPRRLTHFRMWGRTDVWKPLTCDPAQREERGSRGLHVAGRLKPGVSRVQAEANLQTLAARIAQEHPTSFNVKESVRVEDFRRSLIGWPGAGQCYMSLAIACFVLLIGCVNVANLQLARATHRARELALRIALGAGRGRLLRQLLTESLLLALVGSSIGVLLAAWSNDWLAGYINQLLTAVEVNKAGVRFPVDGRVLGYAFAVSVLTGLLFGVLPAIHASRPDINRALKDGGTTASAGRSTRRLQGWLIIGEVAITLVLLIGCSLFGQSLIRVLRMDPGYRTDHRLAMVVHLPQWKYTNDTKAKNLHQELIHRLEAIPGVKRAGLTMYLPVWSPGSSSFFDIQGQPTTDPQSRLAHIGSASSGLFAALGMQLKEGRHFTERDDFDGQAPPVVIINQALARKYFPGRSPLGQRISFGRAAPRDWAEIVGVVNDVKSHAESPPQAVPQLYEPLAQNARRGGWLVLETSVEPESLSETVRRTVAAVDPELAVERLASLERTLASEVIGTRVTAWLLGGFSLLGLLLSAVGVYGVVSFNVARRTHDLGLRMALGAQRLQVLGLVMRHGLFQVGLGLAIGSLGAVVLILTMRSVLEDLVVWDAPTLLSAVAVLIFTAGLACYLPARRATQIEPMQALRCE